jgi:hypothetical protein
LSLASDVFKAMLLGHFKEANMDPDEPIELKNVSPNAFDKAMR